MFQGDEKVMPMATVFDVAKYVLELCSRAHVLPITTWKLQKLIYYCQAWSLVWDDEPLFEEEIQAWANGPVCPELYKVHRGMLKISELGPGDSGHCDNNQRATIEVVWDHYSKKTAQYLSELTHQERPWKEARGTLQPGERGSNVITLESMAEYYGGL